MRPLVLPLCLSIAIASPAAADQVQPDVECIRGEPHAAFERGRPGIASVRFTLTAPTEATEIVRLDDGAELRVEHYGCEYYAARIEIRAPGLLAQGADAPAAYRAAAAWLRRIDALEPRLSYDFALAARTLELALAANPGVAVEDEFRVEGDGIDFLQTQVAIDAASRGKLRIHLYKGPL